jgi:hypothetical protein
MALLVAGGIVAAFVVLVALLIVQRRRLRQWKRAHSLVSSDYRRLSADHQALRGFNMSDDDRLLLSEFAEELRACVETADGELLLDDAEHVYVCTRPGPALEVEHYSADETEAEAGIAAAGAVRA